jgi:hydroxypyruvate reductase
VLVDRALEEPDVVARVQRSAAVDVIAAGKAAHPMLTAFKAGCSVPLRTVLAVGGGEAGHPVPDERSMHAAARALEIAGAAAPDDLVLVLLSGGASSLMALPAGPLSLHDKQQTIRVLLSAGADITALNTVRKHLSAIKGGRLAAASGGQMLTLAISDVVGDDLAVIGSGPTVPDPTTSAMALEMLDRFGGRGAFPAAVVAWMQRGAERQEMETPKPGDLRLARCDTRIIGRASHAVRGAREMAISLGYDVCVLDHPVVGDARTAAPEHVAHVAALAAGRRRPLCVLSSGETTVTVKGSGRGGRNQELALAMAPLLETLGSRVVAASVGTDGVDGPTDAAGAIVDTTTVARAEAAGIPPADRYLADNNSYEFFRALDDLIIMGPTNTNVGDVQIVLVG